MRFRLLTLVLGQVIGPMVVAFGAISSETGVTRTDSGGGGVELQDLKDQLDTMREQYENRIKALEAQMEALQIQLLRMAPESVDVPIASPQAAGASAQYVPNALNPAITVFGNMVGRADDAKVFNHDGNRVDNKMNLREVEIDFRVPIDPYADGVLITAFESESPGEFEVAVEEGYVNIKRLPFMESTPLGLKLKAGRFRPAFGRTNPIHTHDLPQSFRPLPVQEFLGEEGFIQNGLSGNFFLPSPWDTQSSLDATLQVFGSGDVAISPDTGGRASYLGHLRWYRTMTPSQDVELGWSSYYRPAGNGVDRVDFHGLDFMYRWKPLRQGQWRSFLVGGELFFARRAYPEAELAPEVESAVEDLEPGVGKPVGFSVFGQWQFDRRHYAGVRWDQTDVLFDPQLQRRSITPYFSYYFSEFLRFRVNFEHRWSDLFTEDRRKSVFVELNWVFGSHPPEPFWVNK